MTKNKYLYLILLALLTGCNGNKKSNLHLRDDVVSLQIQENNDSYIYGESLFDSVQFIQIQNSPLIGNIDLFTTKNDSLYLVGDTKYTKTLFLINGSGQIINSYKYTGKGPQQGLSLNDIKYDSYSDQFIALFSQPSKLIFFDANLKVNSVLPLTIDFFRFVPEQETFYLYAHDDQKLFQLSRGSSKVKEFINLSEMDYYPFNPTPVFYCGNYFNVPYNSVVYMHESDVLVPILKFKYKSIPKETDTKTFLEEYPPVVKNIYTAGENLIILFTYKYVVRVILYSRSSGVILSQGILMDKIGILDNIFLQRDNYVYGTMTSDRFVSFLDYCRDTATLNNFPKIIINESAQDIREENNPVLVKYYLNSNIDHEK